MCFGRFDWWDREGIPSFLIGREKRGLSGFYAYTLHSGAAHVEGLVVPYSSYESRGVAHAALRSLVVPFVRCGVRQRRMASIQHTPYRTVPPYGNVT